MISFLQPLALLGLAAAAIPPLLHLISRRVPPLITFPPVRYLSETERKQSRRLKLRHLLLLLLRTALIALIAFAASRPVARMPLGTAHEPSDIALVLDNSLSSGAVVDGRSVLDALVDRARSILDRVSNADRVWLTLADGIPHRLSIPEVRAVIDTVTPWPIRLDLTFAARVSSQAMEDGRVVFAREVIVISDMQVSAFGPSEGDNPTRVLVWRDAPTLETNRSLDSAWTEPTVWALEGQVVGAVGGSSTAPATVSLNIGTTNVARAFGAPGELVLLPGSVDPGWHTATVDLDPDELRADDRRYQALVATTPARVSTGAGMGMFVEDVVEALRVSGRIGDGPAVALSDRVVAGTTVLFPPDDPALVGAANRELASRGIGWRFGDIHGGEWQVTGDSTVASNVTVLRRRRLQGSEGDVLLSVSGEPWLVKDRDVVLVGSRFEPAWTNLPLTAGFAPFVDWLVNRVAARQVVMLTAPPGTPISLPPGAESLAGAGGVEIGAGAGVGIAPIEPGVYYLRVASGDTIGALQVNPDPRESHLDRAEARSVATSLGSNVEVLNDGGLDRELFSGARRADLTGLLIAVAILLALVELLVATIGGGRSSEG